MDKTRWGNKQKRPKNNRTPRIWMVHHSLSVVEIKVLQKFPWTTYTHTHTQREPSCLLRWRRRKRDIKDNEPDVKEKMLSIKLLSYGWMGWEWIWMRMSFVIPVASAYTAAITDTSVYSSIWI